MQKIRELLQSVIRNRSNFEEYCAQCNYKKFMNGLLFSDDNFINFKKYKAYLIYSSVFNFIIAIKPLDQSNSEYEVYIFTKKISEKAHLVSRGMNRSTNESQTRRQLCNSP